MAVWYLDKKSEFLKREGTLYYHLKEKDIVFQQGQTLVQSFNQCCGGVPYSKQRATGIYFTSRN
jgi:hypothetical protein